MGWNYLKYTCAPVHYSLHMQEHCKYCMQFSYFWTPVLVLREKPVLRESSDLQLEVCNTLLRFKPLTLLVFCEVKYHES